MKPYCLWIGLAVVSGTAAGAFSQQPVTVQLPTFSAFRASTTVSVPDRGSVLMGGINRAASGRSEFGVPMLPFRPFRNTAIGGERSASNVRVTATIHDFEAMDEYLLSQPTEFRLHQDAGRAAAAAAGPLPAFGPRLADGPAREDGPAAGRSWAADLSDREGDAKVRLAEAQAQRRSQQSARDAEAQGFFQRGQEAEAAGKPGVAKIFYQMAARRATGDLQKQVAARLDALSRGATQAQVVQSVP